MKLKAIFTCLLALMLAMPAGDAYAQSRKSGSHSGTRKKTSSSHSGSSNSAGSLTLSDIEGKSYYGMLIMDDYEKMLGKDGGVYSWLVFDPGEVILYTVGTKMRGSYSVSSNKLKINTDLDLTLTSTDGGKTLRGYGINGRGQKVNFVFFRSKKGKWDSELCKNSFDKGTFKALVKVPVNGDAMMFPVDFKATPNPDGMSGTYKFSVNNTIGIGVVKGTYTITDTGVLFTSNLNGCSTKETEYLKNAEQIANAYLGEKSGFKIYLYLFNQ